MADMWKKFIADVVWIFLVVSVFAMIGSRATAAAKGQAAVRADDVEMQTLKSAQPVRNFSSKKTENPVDSTGEWRTTFGARLQVQGYGRFLADDANGANQPRFGAAVRRLRLKLKGRLPGTALQFYLQPSFDRAKAGLELAYMNWRISPSTELTAGQFKVPATRQFMVSSGDLQLVDRSFADAEHRLLYGVGLMARQRLAVSESAFLQIYESVTTGEGSTRPPEAGGYSYTIRAELLPAGMFDQYRVSDLRRSNDLRLSLASAFNLNRDAVYTGGSSGIYMGRYQTDIATAYFDLLIKYDGWSLLGQAGFRQARRPVGGPNRGRVFAVNEGTTVVLQTGFMISGNTEIAGRYSYYKPSANVEHLLEKQQRYLAGITRYVQGDRYKLQFDVGWIQRSGIPVHKDHLMTRLQVQLDF